MAKELEETSVELERNETWSEPYLDFGAMVQSNGSEIKTIFNEVQVEAIKQLLVEEQLLGKNMRAIKRTR